MGHDGIDHDNDIAHLHCVPFCPAASAPLLSRKHLRPDFHEHIDAGCRLHHPCQQRDYHIPYPALLLHLLSAVVRLQVLGYNMASCRLFLCVVHSCILSHCLGIGGGGTPKLSGESCTRHYLWCRHVDFRHGGAGSYTTFHSLLHQQENGQKTTTTLALVLCTLLSDIVFYYPTPVRLSGTKHAFPSLLIKKTLYVRKKLYFCTTLLTLKKE